LFFEGIPCKQTGAPVMSSCGYSTLVVLLLGVPSFVRWRRQ
jgi:hypothetical protein